MIPPCGDYKQALIVNWLVHWIASPQEIFWMITPYPKRCPQRYDYVGHCWDYADCIPQRAVSTDSMKWQVGAYPCICKRLGSLQAKWEDGFQSNTCIPEARCKPIWLGIHHASALSAYDESSHKKHSQSQQNRLSNNLGRLTNARQEQVSIPMQEDRLPNEIGNPPSLRTVERVLGYTLDILWRDSCSGRFGIRTSG